jgi:glycosyltransferase involved in cell wall biosynthesis
MRTSKPKICVISATPLSVYFFFTEHLRQMSQWADIIVVYNKNYNPEVQPIDAPVVQKHIKIRRRVAMIDDTMGLFSLCSFLYRNQFDMVISLTPKAGFLGMIAASLAKVPSRLHIFQGEVWASRWGLGRRLLKSADTMTAFLSTHLLAVSHTERDFLVNEGVVPPFKINVLGAGSISGVDCNRFKPNREARDASRANLNIPLDATLLLFIGRITEDKGVFELVRVFSKLAKTKPKLFLALVGPDEDKITDNLQALVSPAHKRRLKIFGFTREPTAFIGASDILCLPSYREGFGTVALEAAACAVPVVGSDIHGLQDAVKDGQTGLLVPAGNEDALFEALTKLINNPDLRESLGKRARSRVLAHFDAEHVVNRYVKYFKGILSNKKTAN